MYGYVFVYITIISAQGIPPEYYHHMHALLPQMWLLDQVGVVTTWIVPPFATTTKTTCFWHVIDQDSH